MEIDCPVTQTEPEIRSDPDAAHLGAQLSVVIRYATLGSLVFLAMGICHALVTLIDAIAPAFLAPADPQLTEQMARAPIAMTDRMTVWGGYLGFNYSHSLGLTFFGLIYLLIARKASDLFVRLSNLLPLAICMAGTYCLIAVVFWFFAPAAASAVGGICFIRAYVAARSETDTG